MRLTTTSKDNFPLEGPPCLRVSTISWNSAAVDVKNLSCFGFDIGDYPFRRGYTQ